MGHQSFALKLISILMLILFLAPGCASSEPRDPKLLRVSGASDVLYLATTVKEAFTQSSGLTMEILPSMDALGDLKKGKVDVLLVGRELTPAELETLEIIPVAYDAVCILVASHTYVGGIQQGSVGENIAKPLQKFNGLQQLTLEELRQHYRNILNLNPRENPWKPPNMKLYDYKPYLVGDSLQEKVDPETNTVMGSWNINHDRLGGEMSPLGQFDTQSVLLEKLGLGDVAIDKMIPVVGFNIESEELWISSRYTLGNQDAEVSGFPFNLYLTAVSRQVTVRAIQHEFGVKPLRINGVDPLSSAKDIYGGTYPLSRKIYLVVKKPAAENVEKFVQYLLSDAGQKSLENASFLPLPLNEIGGNQN